VRLRAQAWFDPPSGDTERLLVLSSKTGLVERPETKYVAVGDADVAYQVIGDGPRDLLVFNGLGFNAEVAWLIPEFCEFFERLASFTRLIVFDRRGAGASDHIPRNAIPTWEDFAEDAGAVLDAVGSKQAAVFAPLESGPMALLFAATHPDRVDTLILLNTYARYLVADDYPIGVALGYLDTLLEMLKAGWGSPGFSRVVFPSRADDPEFLDRIGRMQGSSLTPRAVAAQYDYILRNIDVRQSLPLVRVPTLVLHARENNFVPFVQGRYLAEHIDGARFVELPGSDLGYIGDNATRTSDEIAEFLTGERPVEVERILATVLFTDTVGSTQRAATLGDRRWRSILDAHDKAVREQLRRFRGHEINTTGDGFVASFDGPARAIRCAEAISEATGNVGVELRMGLHTGECEVRGDDLGGLAVHIAARVGAQASPGEVLVSGTVKDLVVGSGIEFRDRGEHELKGVPGTWKLFAVEG
jgi:class 3 adenylate cyclase